MAKSLRLPRIDLSSLSSQFKNLDFKNPGQWSLAPKVASWLALTLLVIGAGYAAVLMSSQEELEGERNKEPALKTEYLSKYKQAVNLAELRKQKKQVEEYVTQLEKQLPGKAEMDALLSDINQAGLGRGLQFELFRPGSVAVRDYYAELPIVIKVTGKYHDVGAFASDVANLSRIVTLHDLNISAQPMQGNQRGAIGGESSLLTMDAVARTYRYLDQSEVQAARADKGAKAKPATPAAAKPANEKGGK